VRHPGAERQNERGRGAHENRDLADHRNGHEYRRTPVTQDEPQTEEEDHAERDDRGTLRSMRADLRDVIPGSTALMNKPAIDRQVPPCEAGSRQPSSQDVTDGSEQTPQQQR
jgi:hypothetical protein